MGRNRRTGRPGWTRGPPPRGRGDAVATTPETKAVGTGGERVERAQGDPRRLRWGREEYYRLGELGFFRGKRVELIDGEIFEMPALKPPHVTALELTAEVLRASFGAGYCVRTQAPLDLGRSQPEPDIVVVRGQLRDYVRHPQTALLVVEVSDSTLSYDRRRKAHDYARVGIADYWIVNLIDRQLEVHRVPGPDPARRGRFSYAEVTVVPATGQVIPLAAPNALIAVADLLP